MGWTKGWTYQETRGTRWNILLETDGKSGKGLLFVFLLSQFSLVALAFNFGRFV